MIKGIKPDFKGPGAGRAVNYSDVDKAFSLLKTMKEQGVIKPDEILYNCLIDLCVRFHDVNRAVAVFTEM